VLHTKILSEIVISHFFNLHFYRTPIYNFFFNYKCIFCFICANFETAQPRAGNATCDRIRQSDNRITQSICRVGVVGKSCARNMSHACVPLTMEVTLHALGLCVHVGITRRALQKRNSHASGCHHRAHPKIEKGEPTRRSTAILNVASLNSSACYMTVQFEIYLCGSCHAKHYGAACYPCECLTDVQY